MTGWRNAHLGPSTTDSSIRKNEEKEFYFMTTLNKFTLDGLSKDMHCRFFKGASRNKGSSQGRRYLIIG